MGIFASPTVVSSCSATKYYSGAAGANFGGTCKNTACPANGQQVSHKAGFTTGNPFTMNVSCPGCSQQFIPGWLWFYQTKVTLKQVDNTQPDELFECRTDMRRVLLDHKSTTVEFMSFTTSPL